MVSGAMICGRTDSDDGEGIRHCHAAPLRMDEDGIQIEFRQHRARRGTERGALHHQRGQRIEIHWRRPALAVEQAPAAQGKQQRPAANFRRALRCANQRYAPRGEKAVEVHGRARRCVIIGQSAAPSCRRTSGPIRAARPVSSPNSSRQDHKRRVEKCSLCSSLKPVAPCT